MLLNTATLLEYHILKITFEASTPIIMLAYYKHSKIKKCLRIFRFLSETHLHQSDKHTETLKMVLLSLSFH